MRKEKRFQSLKWIIAVCMILVLTVMGTDSQMFAAQETESGTTADMPEEYSIDRPLLMRGKSLAKASLAANVNDLDSLKKALALKADEIYVNDKINITEDIEFPAGKLRISSGSIYGSVSSNDGGAIVNRGTVEMKGGILQGHTTTQWSKVSPKKASLKSVKNVKGYKAIITWAKVPGADGYRLEYSTDSKFAKKATKTVKVKASAEKSNKPTKTITRLKKGKTYYVRISVYQKDSAGKTYYGKNSTVKKVNIRK